MGLLCESPALTHQTNTTLYFADSFALNTTTMAPPLSKYKCGSENTPKYTHEYSNFVCLPTIKDASRGHSAKYSLPNVIYPFDLASLAFTLIYINNALNVPFVLFSFVCYLCLIHTCFVLAVWDKKPLTHSI